MPTFNPKRILEINADEFFSLGVVFANPPHPPKPLEDQLSPCASM